MFFWRHRPGSSPPDRAEELPSFGRQLDGARRGEAEALSLLYRQFLPGVFAYMAARVPDRATEEAGFTAWLLQIARITVAGYYRKREHQLTMIPLAASSWGEEDEAEESLSFSTHHPEADPIHQAETREEWEEVVKAINVLTEEQRQVLIGRLILGYDVATVARML